jgi:hypothetical protein
MENVIQDRITGGRFKICINEIKGIRSLDTEKILVSIGATQMNIATKSGRDWRIVWGETIRGAQLGICVSSSESSALMLSQLLLIMLSILATPLGDWIGQRLRPQGKSRWEVKYLPNPATGDHCFTGCQHRAGVKKSMIRLNLVADLTQLFFCHSRKRIGENLIKLGYRYQSCVRVSGKNTKEKTKRINEMPKCPL